jgi:hypothetical protein
VQEVGALDAYLLWEFLKQTIRGTFNRSLIDRDAICNSMAMAKELTAELSVEEKIKMVRLFSPFSQRTRLLQEKRWSLEDYPMSCLGTVLPCVGDLPIEEIVKSFTDVALYVRQQAVRPDTLSSVEYIRSLARLPDILETIPIMVIEPGSEQRRLDVLKERGREDLTIFPAQGYIEDGNHRALGQVLANDRRKSIFAYVGRTG